MELVFLGTSTMVPTKDRNNSAVLLRYRTHGLLFDCGENTQRQLKIAGISANKITKVLLSHWHGDHVLGLPGLIQTMGTQDYDKPLEVYGPEGTSEHMKHLFKLGIFKTRVQTVIQEVNSGKFFENNDFILEARELKHTAPCVGFSFLEKDRRRINMAFIKKLGIPQGPLLGKLQKGKDIVFKGKKVKADEATRMVRGKKIVYIVDTTFCQNCIELAKDADILICEATYAGDLDAKADEYQHMTAKQAASIANRANVKKLILTHFSQRYKTTEKILEDAKTYFENVVCAYDFMKVKV